MWDPLALDRHRIDDERIRRHAEEHARHPRVPARGDEAPRRHRSGVRRAFAMVGLRPRAAAGPCTNC